MRLFHNVSLDCNINTKHYFKSNASDVSDPETIADKIDSI